MALVSSVFSCFSANTRNPPRAAAHAATRDKKPGAACRPGFWRSFGEYIFLEDSRYASQAKNRAAVKSFNRQRKSAFPAGVPRPDSALSRVLRRTALSSGK